MSGFNFNAWAAENRPMDEKRREFDMIPHLPRMVCASGLKMSVQASRTHYCLPRDNAGPWVEVEVGFPSERVESLMEYAEDPDSPTGTVYAGVPVDVVEAIVDANGGLAL